MKQRISLFFQYGLFWMIFFITSRVLFLIFQHKLTSELAFTDILLLNLHGLRMDLSTSGYFLLIPGLLIALTVYFKSIVLRIILNTYTLLILFAATFVVVVDLELYKHWGFRLDATPIFYIGKEAAGTGDPTTTILMVLFWLLLYAVSVYGYFKYISSKIKLLPLADWKTSLVMLVLTGCLIAPIRGTTGVAPMNTGVVFFHPTNMFANHAAINVVWNTGYALNKLNKLRYPSDLLSKEKTSAYFKAMHPKGGHTSKLVRDSQPNVMIIILESYTFRFIESLGGIPGITPNINRLVKEGVLFDHFYSSGDRTDKGIVSVLNGYPTQPLTSIIQFPKKTQSLPFLNKDFKKMGYHTEFTYGYNIDYANFRSYLSNAQFDHITHSKDFPQELNTSKWGVHDHYVFDRFYEEANAATTPFFKIMMTQSSHEPFDVPMETVIEGDDENSKFLNSAFYTDKSLGEFIAKAKKSDWWDNTWIVITADHGHKLLGNEGLTNPDRFKIPMLWLGGALTKQDTVIHTYAGHPDIANTILGQFDQFNPDFIFSNNILSDTYPPFALYVYNNGCGYLSPGKHIIYDNTGQRYLKKEGAENTEDEELCKAYMQTLYNDFNNR